MTLHWHTALRPPFPDELRAAILNSFDIIQVQVFPLSRRQVHTRRENSGQFLARVGQLSSVEVDAFPGVVRVQSNIWDNDPRRRL